MLARSEPARSRPVSLRTSYRVPPDVAPLLVSVPVWTRANDYYEAPDQPPSFYANAILFHNYDARLEAR